MCLYVFVSAVEVSVSFVIRHYSGCFGFVFLTYDLLLFVLFFFGKCNFPCIRD